MTEPTPATESPSRFSQVVAAAKADAVSATQRAAVFQFVAIMKTAVATALGAAAKGTSRDRKRAQKQALEFFESEMGGVVFMLMLGSLLPMVPAAWLGPLGPLAETVCREMRVQGLTEGMVMASDVVLAPMRAALESLNGDPRIKKAIQELGEAQVAASTLSAEGVSAPAT